MSFRTRNLRIATLFASTGLLALSSACSSPTDGYFSLMGDNPRSLDGDTVGDDTLTPGPTPPPGGQPGELELKEEFSFSGTTTQIVERHRDIDLLWMIDNSISMDPYQRNIAEGFRAFAEKYFNADRDIRIATIPSDTWVAGQAEPPTVRDSTQDGSNVPVDYGPGKGSCYARLLPGIHDGIRPNVGSHDLNCKATLPLDPGRSGSPILSTRKKDGTPSNLAQLIQDFQTNAMVGVNGAPSERGLQSVFKLLDDNEECPSCYGPGSSRFFLPKRLRGLIFVADEHSHDLLSYNGQTVDNTEKAYKQLSDAKVVESAKKAAALFKSRMDRFFTQLDGSSKDPGYFVVSIANLTCKKDCGVCDKPEGCKVSGKKILAPGYRISDHELWGPEYEAVVDVVKADSTNSAGKYSIKADLEGANFAAILDQIGKAAEEVTDRIEVKTFTLKKAPLRPAEVKVEIFGEGKRYSVPQEHIRLRGQILEVALGWLPDPLPSSLRIEVSYAAAKN